MTNAEPNLHGPEDMPLREYVKTFPMVINVYDLKTDKIVRHEKIDYSNFDHRKWLGKISYWAAMNGCSVETMSAEDHEKYNK